MIVRMSISFPIFSGIGLDDAFVLFSSYSRTDQNRDPVERICDTIDDVGYVVQLMIRSLLL